MSNWIALVVFILSTFSAVKGNGESGKCEKAKKDIIEKNRNGFMIDANLPFCDENGDYKSVSCMSHPISGCWCVNTTTGKSDDDTFILNALVSDMECGEEHHGQYTKCQKERKASLKKINEQMLLNQKAQPLCDPDGMYARVRCFWGRDERGCYCANPDNGEIYKDTFVLAAEANDMECGGRAMDETKCQKERKASLKKINEQWLLGQDAKPDCEPDGTYVKIKCIWPPEKQGCGCIDTLTGEKVPGSFKENTYPNEIDCDKSDENESEKPEISVYV